MKSLRESNNLAPSSLAAIAPVIVSLAIISATTSGCKDRERRRFDSIDEIKRDCQVAVANSTADTSKTDASTSNTDIKCEEFLASEPVSFGITITKHIPCTDITKSSNKDLESRLKNHKCYTPNIEGWPNRRP